MQNSDLNSFLSVVPVAAIVIAGDERIEAANEAAERLSAGQIVGRHYMSVLRQPDLVSAVESVRAQGGDRMTRMRQVRGEGDTLIDVHCIAVPDTSPRKVILWFEDVTHVEQAGQIRRDFVANVSHELRTPLTSLMGFIETLQGPAKDDPAAREQFLEIMALEAARMERLVSDLLSLSRVETEERRAPTEQVDIVVLVKSVAKMLRRVADEAGVTLDVDLIEAQGCVIGDEDQLRQVFSNLIENAIKYGAAGKVVTASLQNVEQVAGLRGAGVMITISDKGPGIDPLHLPRLTERFYRVDSHRSREVGGTGLGLAIVKHIISRHRGRLRIESEVGRGSAFSVILPTA